VSLVEPSDYTILAVLQGNKSNLEEQMMVLVQECTTQYTAGYLELASYPPPLNLILPPGKRKTHRDCPPFSVPLWSFWYAHIVMLRDWRASDALVGLLHRPDWLLPLGLHLALLREADVEVATCGDDAEDDDVACLIQSILSAIELVDWLVLLGKMSTCVLSLFRSLFDLSPRGRESGRSERHMSDAMSVRRGEREGMGGGKGNNIPVTNLPTPPTMSNTPLKMSAMKAKKPMKRLAMPATKEWTMV